MEKKKSFFERRPYVCYALYAGLLFAFNLFLRWWSGELDADEYLMSAINTLILTAGLCGVIGIAARILQTKRR